MSNWLNKAQSGTGGFLNNADALITDYEFTKTPPFETADETDDLFFVLTVQEDGKDEPTTTTLRCGGGKFFDIQENGKVLGSIDADRVPRLWAKADVVALLASLDEAGFPLDERLPDPEESKTIDLRGILGTRVRFVQEPVLDEKTGQPLKTKPKTSGKHKGKSFTVTRLKVAKVLALPGKAAAAAPKPGAKVAKPVVADADVTAAELYEDADTLLTNLLADVADHSVKKAALNLAVTRHATKVKLPADQRESLRTVITSDEYIQDAVERGVIALSKAGVVSLPA